MDVTDNSNLTYKLNHMPQQVGVWVAYTGFRYKDLYDIETFDGQFYTKMRPNADSFHSMVSSIVIKDEDVKSLRLTPEEHLDPDYELTGVERIERNLEMFASLIEQDNPTGAPLISMKPDFTELTKLITNIQKEIVDTGSHSDDDAYYVWEEVMKAYFGPAYFDWYNKVIT